MLKKAALALALAGLAPTGAAAQDCDARCHFQRGQSCYETGDHECAVNEWQAAYNMDSRPALQYNLAQAYERLGRYDEAVRSYEVYIASAAPDDQRATLARGRVAQLQQRLGNTSVVFSGGPEGAQIFVDGGDRGRLPHPDPLRVEPGSHRIVIRAEGYQDFVSTVAVSPGQSATVEIEMVPGQSGLASTGGSIPLVGIIVAAVGGAVAIGGAVTGGLALSRAGQANARTGTAPNGESNEAIISDAETLALVADILIPVGAAAAVAGIVLMFVLPPDGGGGGGGGGYATAIPLVGPDLVGVGVAGAF
jgi:tetratricopeptide (TPR) repeat protein